MEDFQTGEETSFAVDEVSGIIKDVSYIIQSLLYYLLIYKVYVSA